MLLRDDVLGVVVGCDDKVVVAVDDAPAIGDIDGVNVGGNELTLTLVPPHNEAQNGPR